MENNLGKTNFNFMSNTKPEFLYVRRECTKIVNEMHSKRDTFFLLVFLSEVGAQWQKKSYLHISFDEL